MSTFVAVNDQIADELGAVAEFASTDGYRVPITKVWVEVRRTEAGHELKVWATDSHVLGIRTVFIGDDHIDSSDVGKRGTWTLVGGFDAKEWKTQLKAVIKSAKVGLIGLEFTHDEVEVGRAGGIAVKLRGSGAIVPPKIDQILDGFTPIGEEPVGPVQVALDPNKLVQITKGITMTPSKRGQYPLRFYVPEGAKVNAQWDEHDRLERYNMGPWFTEVVHAVGGAPKIDADMVSRLVAVIMPVRLRDGWLASSVIDHRKRLVTAS